MAVLPAQPSPQVLPHALHRVTVDDENLAHVVR